MEEDMFGHKPSDSGGAYARHSDPETSHDAAESVSGTQANRLERIIYETLLDHPDGLMMHEICEKTQLVWNTASPRMKPLVNKGRVVDSGQRREGPAGKLCIVWQAIIPKGIVGL